MSKLTLNSHLDYVLQLCCSTRNRFQKPFTKEGYVYATNSFIIVRVKADSFEDGAYPIPEDVNAGRGVRVRDAVYGFGTEQPVSYEMRTSDLLGMLSLYGAYVTKRAECAACKGSGEGECPHCGNETECEDCGGSGKTGEGESPILFKFREHSIELNGTKMDPQYLNVIVLAHAIAGVETVHLTMTKEKIHSACGPFEFVLMAQH